MVASSSLSNDYLRLEFQGSLVKVVMRGCSVSQDCAQDEYRSRWFRRAFNQYVKEHPNTRRYYHDGRLLAADLGIHALEQIDALALRLHRLGSGAKRPLRGRIYEFSRKSRKRLLEVAARLRRDVKAMFLTYTYRENVTDHVRAKRDLELVLLWFRRNVPQAAALWRLEYQTRGAIHFHILLLGVSWLPPNVFNRITPHWHKVSGDDSYPDIEPVRSRKSVMGYVSKYLAYVAKPRTDAAESFDGAASAAGGGEAAGLDSVPYSDIASSAPSFVGRFWGISNRRALPLAELRVRQFNGRPSTFLQFRRMMRRAIQRRYRLPSRVQGFSAFVDSSQWLRLWDTWADDDWINTYKSPAYWLSHPF
jgi:hypothetical protein